MLFQNKKNEILVAICLGGGRNMKNKNINGNGNEVDYGKLIINADWCKGCGICTAFCPTKAIELKNEKVSIADINKCTECGLCELRCPDYAIYVGRKKNEQKD